MSPKVSVITVCRNEASGIRRTLESVLEQTFKDFEYIVVDGASTDGTKDIIESYSERITHFVSEKDTGIYNAMNKGAKLAKGEYLIFINGGDALFAKDVLEQIFASNPSEEIIYGDLWIESEKSQLGRSPDQISLGFLFYSTLWHPVSFIKRSLFERLGPYDENLKIVADYDFFLNAIGKHKVSHRRIPIIVARFNTYGIGSNPKYATQRDSERLHSQKKYFSDEIIAQASKEALMLEEQIKKHNSLVRRIARGFRYRVLQGQFANYPFAKKLRSVFKS